MRIAVVLLNLAEFLFASFVLATDGPPDPGADTLFALWSLLTRVLSAGMILWTADSGGWLGLAARITSLAKTDKTNATASVISGLILLAIVCNVVLIGLVGWHLAEQYNHPAESGVIVLVLLMVLTPPLSLAVLLRSAPRPTRRSPHLGTSAPQ